MTFISIITPFNKGKRYLEDYFDSLIDQNLEDYEIILIVNGASEDISDMLDEYSSKLNLIVKSFDEEINVGQARNEGLKIATGKYVYFMDSDDYIYSDGLSKLINVAKDTDADFINGERINTAFIRERFEEEFQKESKLPLKKGKTKDKKFAFQLLVGKKTNRDEFISILHALIKKELIDGIYFDEDTRYEADYDFTFNALEKMNKFIGVENAIYAKRTRDDPINLTSLNQEEKEHNFLRTCDIYQYSVKRLNSNKKFKQLSFEVTNKLFTFYSFKFVPNFLKYNDEEWGNEYFDRMVEVSKDFNKLALGTKQKKEVEALQSGDRKAYARILKLKSRFNKFKKLFKSKRKFDLSIYYDIFNKQPINEKQIIFISFRGDYYTDSPKYLYQYLYENHKDDFDFVWVVNDKNIKIPGNPKRVERFSLNYYRELAKSKYWVINGRQAARLRKREEQVIISTWHGTPLKKLGLDMDNVYTEDPNIKKSYVKVARAWDYLISPNRFTTNVYKSAFAFDEGEIIESGYPRNDILYNADEEFIKNIKSRLKIPADKKVILYAPTWRDDEFIDTGKVKFKLKLELDKMKDALGDEYIVLIRTHYFISNNLDLSDMEDFAFDVSEYDDIAELYLSSDILITDYSSVFFDFANLKKPILFYTYDLDKYANVLRGFYLDVNEDLPGPLLFTTEEVIESILNIDSLNEEYSQKYEEFYDRFCSFEDGNASKRIVERIWNY